MAMLEHISINSICTRQRRALSLAYFVCMLSMLAVSCGPKEHAQDVRNLESPAFPIRGWESQLENFWCKWMGGEPEWFRNEHYLAYLRDAFSRAPKYHVNTFMLMGRGDEGELHTFVHHSGWDKLFARLSEDERRRADEQAQVLEGLAREAKAVGVDLFVWDHELQLPKDFAVLYPEARGVDAAICPSSPIVWRLLSDKYDEFFGKVPTLAGIVLVFAETQFNMLEGSPCHCDLCRGKPGAYFVEKIIKTASQACRKHGKQLVVRNFGHNWDQLETVLEAIRSVDAGEPFVAMSKMVPCDFFGLRLPPDPSTVALPGRARILEDVVGGEFRGKTHNIVIPDEYYTQHLRHAAEHGGSGAVFRLDHSAYPRSVFETPNEFNVWLSSQLMLDPYQSLDALWLQWINERYGSEAAPYVIEALGRSDDIWEWSTNSLGFYSTSAHGHIAPFFRGPYNAFDALRDVGHIRARISPEMEKKFQELLRPDRSTLAEVVREREQAIQWAVDAVSALQKAKPHLRGKDFAELSHYLELQLAAARLWRDLGDLFFTGMIILQADAFPDDLVDRLYHTSDRALRHGNTMIDQFGRGWPVVPDADGRGTTLQFAIAGLWGELLDVILNPEPEPLPWTKEPIKPHNWGKKRSPHSAAEALYLAMLQTASGMGPDTLSLDTSARFKSMQFEGTTLVVESLQGKTLSLPLGIACKGPVLTGGVPCTVRVKKVESQLFVEIQYSKAGSQH